MTSANRVTSSTNGPFELTLTLPNKLLATLLIIYTAWCFAESCNNIKDKHVTTTHGLVSITNNPTKMIFKRYKGFSFFGTVYKQISFYVPPVLLS